MIAGSRAAESPLTALLCTHAGMSAFFFYGFLSSVALTPYNFISVSFTALSFSALPIL